MFVFRISTCTSSFLFLKGSEQESEKLYTKHECGVFICLQFFYSHLLNSSSFLLLTHLLIHPQTLADTLKDVVRLKPSDEEEEQERKDFLKEVQTDRTDVCSRTRGRSAGTED